MSQLIPSLMQNGRGDRLQRLLDKVPGMESKSSYQWRWSFEGHAAEVSVAPGDAIQISFAVPEPPPKAVALAANRGLPGNVRFALGRRLTLLADTQLDGEVHLPRSLDEIKSGLLFAMDGQRGDEAPQPLPAEEVQSAIDTCRFAEDHVVQLDDAWEFRPRLRGDATPVKVEIDGDQLRLCRRVVADFRSAVGAEAVAEQALRFNEQLRHARLSVAGEALVAEARLHGEQLTATWLETASRAVAVAWLYTEEVLNILAEDVEIADFFAAMFNSVEDEAEGSPPTDKDPAR